MSRKLNGGEIMKQCFGIVLFVLLLGTGLAQAQNFTTNPYPPGTPTALIGSIGAGPVSITQSSDTTTVTSGNSASCNDGFTTVDNSYFRRFLLNTDYSLSGAFTVNSVTIGVEVATAPSTTQPVKVNLYTIPVGDPLLYANLTLIGTSTFDMPDCALTIVNIPVSGTVANPVGTDLVVEIFSPGGNWFFIGSNTSAETHPSYIAAALCGIPEPTALAAVGFPDMHILMVVNGVENAGVPTLSQWGFMAFMLLLIGSAWIAMRRERRA